MTPKICHVGDCIEKYSSYFSPKMKKFFQSAHWPVPYMLELIDENCTDTKCRHHVFCEDFRWGVPGPDGQRSSGTPQEWTEKIHNCLCLMSYILDEGPSLAQIAAAYGVSRQAIEALHGVALKKLRNKFVEEGTIDK